MPIDESFLKIDFIDGSILDGVKESKLLRFGFSKTPRFNFFTIRKQYKLKQSKNL